MSPLPPSNPGGPKPFRADSFKPFVVFPPMPFAGLSDLLSGLWIARYPDSGNERKPAFQVFINCLEENDAVLPGQFS